MVGSAAGWLTELPRRDVGDRLMVADVGDMRVLTIAQGKKAVGSVTRCACPGGLGRGWVSSVCAEQNSSLRPVVCVN